MQDRTRATVIPSAWSSPEAIIRACANQYQIDKWAKQPERIEVWIEKEALAGVIEGICDELNVPYLSCRGYTSQSEMWQSARRQVGREEETGQRTVVLHLGDHDPSGLDMTRDIRDRLGLFGSGLTLVRIALNMDQIEQYEPPPNPAKSTDSRFATYEQEFGDESWELDALEPSVISALIEQHVLEHRDPDLWAAAVKREEEEKAQLKAVSDRWEDVIGFLGAEEPEDGVD